MSILDGWNAIPSLFHCSDASNIAQDTSCPTTAAFSDAAERSNGCDDASKNSTSEESALTHIDAESRGTTRRTTSGHAESALVDGVDDLSICEDTQVLDDEEQGLVIVHESREEMDEETEGVEVVDTVGSDVVDEDGLSSLHALTPSEDACSLSLHFLPGRQPECVSGIMIDGTSRLIPPTHPVQDLLLHPDSSPCITTPNSLESNALYRSPKLNVRDAPALEPTQLDLEATAQSGLAETASLNRQLEDNVRLKEAAVRENEDLRMMLHQAALRRNELVAEKEELSRRVTEVEEELDLRAKENITLSEKLHMSQHQAESLANEKVELTGQLQIVSLERNGLVQENDRLVKRLHDACSRKAAAEQDNQQLRQYMQDSYTQRDAAVNERDELTHRVRAVESQRDSERRQSIDALSGLSRKVQLQSQLLEELERSKEATEARRMREEEAAKQVRAGLEARLLTMEVQQLADKNIRAWRDQLEDMFLDPECPPRRSAMPGLNNLFNAIETYSDIKPGGMTYRSLNTSKILRTMKRISALEREDVPRDGEFKYRKRAKALVKKWKVVWQEGEEKARRENLA